MIVRGAASPVLRVKAFRTAWILSLLLAMLVSPVAAQSEPPKADFWSELNGHFQDWDSDGDGSLSFQETSRLVPDPKIKAETAAALAAVHLAQRGQQGDQTSAFPRNELVSAPPPGVTSQLPFPIYYRISLAHIRATSRKLFTGDQPNLNSMHQGLLGDCYFVATLGAIVNRNPSDVSKLVRSESDGSFFVTFPDGERARVPTLSDTEIALGSFALGQGLWLNVLEKAYGELLQRSDSRRGIVENAIDAVANGGHATAAMTLFTGCDSGLLRFRPGDPLIRPSDRRVDGYLPLARNLLLTNTTNRLLTTCATSDADTPPGIPKRHLHTVIGFDAATDVVRVWNPWGNHFTPKDAPGLSAGYSIKNGVFSLPLADFIQIFDCVVYETTNPASY